MHRTRLKQNGIETPTLETLDRACAILGMKADTHIVCERMLREYDARQRYGGYSEAGLTAASLYLSSRLLFERTLGQKETSDACCVAQVTLRSYVRKLRSRVNVNYTMATYWSDVKERVFERSTGCLQPSARTAYA